MIRLNDTDFHQFTPLYLEDMKGAELQNRLDFKFAFNRSHLIGVLNDLQNYYRVLEINGIRLQRYSTVYFDTEGHELYNAHHNRHGNRMKVRIRHYMSNNLCFAEVKSKLNTGRTIKKRIPVTDLQSPLPDMVLNGVATSKGIKHCDLKAGVKITFDRLTLVALNNSERLTVDLNLKMESGSDQVEMPHLVIAELKLYTKESSVFRNIMQEMRIRPWSVSKYCLAVSLLKNNVRKNNFKSIHNYLNKIQNHNLNGTRPV